MKVNGNLSSFGTEFDHLARCFQPADLDAAYPPRSPPPSANAHDPSGGDMNGALAPSLQAHRKPCSGMVTWLEAERAVEALCMPVFGLRADHEEAAIGLSREIHDGCDEGFSQAKATRSLDHEEVMQIEPALAELGAVALRHQRISHDKAEALDDQTVHPWCGREQIGLQARKVDPWLIAMMARQLRDQAGDDGQVMTLHGPHIAPGVSCILNLW
jgi:hypothetical protein